ncbi:MAG: hypothetical protein J6Y96_01050 [Mycoplasma sp.]|nr:hypothetical protein [Mycoplasma sp.]
MNIRTKIISLSLLLSSLPICTILTSCSCSSHNQEFNNLFYGEKTPEINKKNRKEAMLIASKHFEEQWSVTDYGTTIKEEIFNSEIKPKTITCYEYYWNIIYYFASICNNNTYQIVNWNSNKSEELTIKFDIELKYPDGNHILLAKESNQFEYSFDENGVIIITLDNDDKYTIPSYKGSYIKVIK